MFSKLGVFEKGFLQHLCEFVLHLLTKATVPLQQSHPPLCFFFQVHPSLPLQDGRQLPPVLEEDEGCSCIFKQSERGPVPNCTGPWSQDVLHHGHRAIGTGFVDAVALCVHSHRTKSEVTLC